MTCAKRISCVSGNLEAEVGLFAPVSDFVASQQERAQQRERGIVRWRLYKRELVAAEVQLLQHRLVPLQA